MSLEDDLRKRAAELGFVACGISDLAPVPHGAELDRWLEQGYAGTMRYLHRQAAKRKAPGTIVPEAISAVVICDNYYYDEPPRTNPPLVARYAGGTDYHIVTRNRINKLADWLLERGAKTARPYVDAGPVPERELAQRAGLGWIGKNTMLIHPERGSFFFLAVVLTDLSLRPDPPFETDHCGTCTRCLDACPTGAFVAPRVLDATRCISYLTIELRGEVAPALADRFEGWAFGCDICNEVCPWNQKFSTPSRVEEFAPRPLWREAGDPGFFDAMDENEFAEQFSDTPIERPGLEGMRRNWRIGTGKDDPGDRPERLAQP